MLDCASPALFLKALSRKAQSLPGADRHDEEFLRNSNIPEGAEGQRTQSMRTDGDVLEV